MIIRKNSSRKIQIVSVIRLKVGIVRNMHLILQLILRKYLSDVRNSMKMK